MIMAATFHLAPPKRPGGGGETGAEGVTFARASEDGRALARPMILLRKR
jgi:hypothetical protein